VACYRRQFELEFLELQDPRNSSGRLIYVFVRRSLASFKLLGLYNEACILNEAYMRGIRLIEQAQPIHNPAAWLRKTAYNIIREYARDRDRVFRLEDYQMEQLTSPHNPDRLEEMQSNVAMLQMAFQVLDPKDQQLLNLKIVKELSWRDIREVLCSQGEKDCSEAVLRKRKERALIRLRKKFHSLNPPL
jgi:RNA polymerase sigma factor (sigma-70 family)